MLFHTHFYKKDIHQWKDVPSPQHSIVLKAIPNGELVTKKTIVNNVMVDKDNDLIKWANDVAPYLNDLVLGGYVAEIHSERIYKWVKTLS
jgi:hypothetical protein